MPAPKLLAAFAVALTAAFLQSPSPAQASSLQLCFTNKAWVVWEYSFEVTYDTVVDTDDDTGERRYGKMSTRVEGRLLLGQNACWRQNPRMSNLRFTVQSNFGGMLNIGSRNTDTTVRLDGTVFNARMSVLDGVKLD